MRLWHYKLLPYLPKSQLVAQWRELNTIYSQQPNHILINYVYEYEKLDLYEYSALVETEMIRRGIHFRYSQAYYDYFEALANKGLWRRVSGTYQPFINHQTSRYLLQNFYNLQEKYDRGQKDFSKETYLRLENFIMGYFEDGVQNV